MKTPVAFFGFNRPHTTERVFAAIREVKPPKLLLVVDGPRSDKPEEAEKCAEVRAIIEKVDWDCQVYKNYAEANMGCKHRVASGLDWVFNTVEEAIIVEDDCLPNPSFFQFCEEMLDLYRNEPRVMMISGTNYLEEWKSSGKVIIFLIMEVFGAGLLGRGPGNFMILICRLGSILT
jgi:hypothetical protein